MLVFESRRFVELRKQSFWRQMTSSESTGMGIFYTLNVFCIQVGVGAVPGGNAGVTGGEHCRGREQCHLGMSTTPCFHRKSKRV